jgi:hypothetical protein
MPIHSTLATSITPMDRPPPPPAPRYSDGRGSGERRQIYTQHPGVGSSASGRPRSGTGGSSDFVFVEPEPRTGGYSGAYTGASHASSSSGDYGYSDSGASSGGYGRTPMDDITPCGGPKMMVRPGKPDKPAKSKRSLHMETPSKQGSSGSTMDKESSALRHIGSHSSSVGGLQIFDETARSPWTSNRVDVQLSCMITEKVRIHSPAHMSIQSLQGNSSSSSSSSSSTDTTTTIFGGARPSRRASKAPPPPMWTNKENGVNSSTRSGRHAVLRQSSSLSSGSEESNSFGASFPLRSSSEMSLGDSNESHQSSSSTSSRMDICNDNDEDEDMHDRTPSGKSRGRSSDSFRRRKRTRTESEVSGGSHHSDTPDAQEEGYRRERRRSSSINTLMHALGVEVGEDDLVRRASAVSFNGASHRHSSRHSSRQSSSSHSSSRRRGGRRSRPKSHSSGSSGEYGSDGNNETLSRALCSKIVGRMRRHGIRLLALDWDLTVLDCHTKNKWWGPAEELAKHIRPLFKHLMEQAIAAEITVAIVTFSEQTRYIRDALGHAVQGGSGIIVRGGDGSWDSTEIFDCYFDRDLVLTDDENPGHNTYGKLPHLASAMREVERRTGGVAIERDDLLLVDDDHHNIMIAGAQQLKTVRFRDNDVNRAFGEMGEMFSRSSSDSPRNNFGSPAISRTGSRSGSRAGSANGSNGSPSGSSRRNVGRRSRTNSGLRSVTSQMSKK